MNTIKDFIINLFGVYSPTTYSNGEYDVIPNGVSGLDIAWIAGFILFALSLYCVFRIIGGLLKDAFGN